MNEEDDNYRLCILFLLSVGIFLIPFFHEIQTAVPVVAVPFTCEEVIDINDFSEEEIHAIASMPKVRPDQPLKHSGVKTYTCIPSLLPEPNKHTVSPCCFSPGGMGFSLRC